MNKLFISILIFISLISCKKEETKVITINSRGIDKDGGIISFYENDFVSIDNLIAKLNFNENIVKDYTVINFFRVKKDDFPYYTNYSFYPLSDIISFTPNNIKFNGEINIEIPYTKLTKLDNAFLEVGFSNNLLFNRQHLFKLYELPNTNIPIDSLLMTNEWTEVLDFEIDSTNSIVKFNTNNFNKRYIFAYPEYKRQDKVICNIINDSYNYGEYFSFSYINNKYANKYEMGFVHIDNYSFFDISASKIIDNNTNVNIYLTVKIKHNSTGVFSNNDIKVVLKMSFFEDDELYGTTTENTSNTTVEITEFGCIGESINGKITGTMENKDKDIQFNIEILFEAIRTR